MTKLAGGSRQKLFRLLWLAVVVAAVIYAIVGHIGVFGNVLLVLLGFGAVVVFHEFGHFLVAKLVGIKVEAFSIGFPPTLLGIQRAEQGLRFRILPGFVDEGTGDDDGSLVSFTLGRAGPAWDTEYRVGLIPIGGYVKMLGQDDTGAEGQIDDPRSFSNKPVIARAPVIAAGVLFNILSAVAIFVVVFLLGIRWPAPIVGGVEPNSPAARAGLRPGDEVVEIAGRRADLDFSNIVVAAALSGRGEQVPLKVRHSDGSVEELSLVAESRPGEPMKRFGIAMPMSLTVARLSAADANELYARTALRSGDRIVSINGEPVAGYWQFSQIIKKLHEPAVTVGVERRGEDGLAEFMQSRLELDWSPVLGSSQPDEPTLCHVYSMVPRLRITAVVAGAGGSADRGRSGGILQRLRRIFGSGEGEQGTAEPVDLKVGDIIVGVGSVAWPTYHELREQTRAHENKPLQVRVLRESDGGGRRVHRVTVVPKRMAGTERVIIGISVALDASEPVVAKTIDPPGKLQRLPIPSGARIVAVDGVAVKNFYEVIEQIRKYPGQRISLDWRVDEQNAGSVALEVGDPAEGLVLESMLAVPIPFEPLKRLYKADGPVEAVVMGCRKTVMYVEQAYMTILGLLGGLVSPRHLIGPVGIMAASYRIVAERQWVEYIFLIGLINAVIAVFNFLPLPPLDGGLIVLLIAEKIKGAALSRRVQGIVVRLGWVLVLGLFIYVTVNDIIRNFLAGP